MTYARIRMTTRKVPRRGVAAVEMAMLMPVFCLVCLAAVDFGRAFHSLTTVSNSARNGAIYGADAKLAAKTSYSNIQEAALSDVGNLSPKPTVSSTYGNDSAGGAYVEVTVEYQFQCVIPYPGIPSPKIIQRKVRMMIAPS